MTETTRVLVHGASGRMGQAVLRLLRHASDLDAVAQVSRSRPDDATDVPWFAAFKLSDVPQFDVAIDFSLPEAFDALLQACSERRAGMVSGTTGLSDAQSAAIEAASTTIPVVWAANFSLGVAVLSGLVERAARSLPGWDCDIVESHHAHKKDAPSGTALALGARAEAGGSVPRYASLRAGDIVGEHLVQLTGMGERLELVHRATDRDVFARGALHVASRLRGRPPGLYSVIDLLD